MGCRHARGELRDVGYADMGWGAAVPGSCTVGMLTVGWVCLAMQVYTQGRYNCGMECAPVPDDTVGWCLVIVTVDVCLAGLMSFREVVNMHQNCNVGASDIAAIFAPERRVVHFVVASRIRLSWINLVLRP